MNKKSEIEQRLHKMLAGAFAGAPTQLKDIRNGSTPSARKKVPPKKPQK